MYFLIYYFSFINLEITHATSDTKDLLENKLENEPEPNPKLLHQSPIIRKRKVKTFNFSFLF